MLSFENLWKNHPTVAGNDNPCSTNGKVYFSNQCAIRVGVALTKSGVKTKHIPGATHCWHHPASEGHVIRAEELAKGLAKVSLAGLKPVDKLDPMLFSSKLASRKGILFFKDYWQRSGESSNHRSGDHIDLWNGSRLTDWTTWLRIQLHLSLDGVWSDYRGSKAVWFWEVPG